MRQCQQQLMNTNKKMHKNAFSIDFKRFVLILFFFFTFCFFVSKMLSNQKCGRGRKKANWNPAGARVTENQLIVTVIYVSPNLFPSFLWYSLNGFMEVWNIAHIKWIFKPKNVIQTSLYISIVFLVCVFCSH